jgi:hypothetical protein
MMKFIIILLLFISADLFSQENLYSNEIDSMQMLIKLNKELFDKLELNKDVLTTFDTAAIAFNKEQLKRILLKVYDKRREIIDENIYGGMGIYQTKKEDKTLFQIRKYLGVSRDVFAIILAIIHLATF